VHCTAACWPAHMYKFRECKFIMIPHFMGCMQHSTITQFAEHYNNL
jgi:hypothetical protein